MAKKETKSSGESKLVPLHDRIVLKRDEAEGKTAGGIVLPDTAKDRRRLADRLVRHGIPPAMVREAVRPDEGTRDQPVPAAAGADAGRGAPAADGAKGTPEKPSTADPFAK